jgi:hypothetical protein
MKETLQNVDECYTIANTRPRSLGRLLGTMLLAILQQFASQITVAVLVVVAFYLSLLSTSLPPAPHERVKIDRAIALLDEKGFDREVFLLKRTTTFRGTDHWLNMIIPKENAYAATNFPFQIITLYNDFYTKAVDDTERAMILLHEARHLMGEGENEAYAYVWRNRHRIGWTLMSHGTTPSYVTIEQQTREHAPELFNCPKKPWEDCTEVLTKRR